MSGGNTTIHALSTTTAIVAADEFVFWQASASGTYKTTASQVANAVFSQTATIVTLASGGKITSAGNFTIGSGTALATNATVGFAMIQSCAGVPSGAPVGFGAGAVPIVIDTTNFRIYAYMPSGAWKMTQLT